MTMAASLSSDDETISTSEYLIRVATVRVALRKADLLGLLSFGDCQGDTNVCYFTPCRPLDGVSDIANVMIFVPAYGEALLFVSEQCCGYASEVTTALQVCSFSEMWGRLGYLLRNVGKALTKGVRLNWLKRSTFQQTYWDKSNMQWETLSRSGQAVPSRGSRLEDNVERRPC
jgi:hypothetical protein